MILLFTLYGFIMFIFYIINAMRSVLSCTSVFHRTTWCKILVTYALAYRHLSVYLS